MGTLALQRQLLARQLMIEAHQESTSEAVIAATGLKPAILRLAAQLLSARLVKNANRAS
jgi:hypothetical protein